MTRRERMDDLLFRGQLTGVRSGPLTRIELWPRPISLIQLNTDDAAWA
jgi:hypothetical protein